MAAEDFRALVEHAPDAIVVSREGVVLYANAAAARLLGHDDVSGIVGKPMTFLDRRSVEVMRRRIEQMAVTGERLIPREYPARRRDGTEIMAEIASTMIDFEGAPAVLAYARDVTDRKRLLAQLAVADRLASLGMMAAGVAHEINNPLAVVALAAEALARRAPHADDDEAALVAQARAGIDRIAAIVRDLRFFGRDDEEQPGPVDLGAAIESAERLVAHELLPRGALTKQLDALPAVLGVRRQIEQVFVNLFLNAAHALEGRTDGRVVVRSHAAEGRVIITVEDNGCGIPPAMLAAVFEPFFTTRAASGGTGLGLSICRDMLVRAGGTLSAGSTPGGGTTMEVTLPEARRADPRLAALPPALSRSLEAARAAGAAPAADPGVTTARMRVLVVDDEPLIVRSLSAMLDHRAIVTGVTVAERALELMLGDPPFDVVVCDVMMPGLTGADLHERVARERPGREASFVFITGGTYTARTRDYFERVPNARLMKPFSTTELLAAIERVASG